MKNIRLVFNHIPHVTPLVRKALARQVAQSAKNIETHVHDRMREPKHGKTYTIGGKQHTASAPGEAPAVLTGELIESVEEYAESELTHIVPSTGIQAWWEYGLRGLPARPCFRPAVGAEEPEFTAGCEAAVRLSEHV